MARRKADGEQTVVPGSDKDKVQEIEAAARNFKTANEAWKDAGTERAEKAESLLKAMHEHGRQTYRTVGGDLLELVTSSEKVKLTPPERQ